MTDNKREHQCWFKRKRKRIHVYLTVRDKYYCSKNEKYRIEGEINMAGLKGLLKASITSPVGGVTQLDVESADDGSFVASFVAAMEGVYSMLVEFAGEGKYQASSAKIDVTVLPVPVQTSITLTGPDKPVYVGDPVSISGVFVANE